MIRLYKYSGLCTNTWKKFCKKWALICQSLMWWWLIGIILGEIISKSSNWQHIERLKIAILGPNWRLFRLERMAKAQMLICLFRLERMAKAQMLICLNRTSILLICNENKETCVANLIIEGIFSSKEKIFWGLCSEWVKIRREIGDGTDIHNETNSIYFKFKWLVYKWKQMLEKDDISYSLQNYELVTKWLQLFLWQPGL